MIIRLAHAYCDENGKSSGGKPGDQLQKTKDDTIGEVRISDFYVNKKGWRVLRLKNLKYAKRAAKYAKRAANNANIGYSQSDRYGIIACGTDTKVKCNCDCSSLVRKVVMEATGKQISDFSTEDEVRVLEATGLFEPAIDYVEGKTTLYTGDILVTKIKGHTATVIEAEPRTNPYPEPELPVTSKQNAKMQDLNKYVSEGLTVKWVQYMLCAVGFQFAIDQCGGIDGVCGTGTTSCIAKYQSAKKLEIDGICGKKTISSLKKDAKAVI